MALSSVCVLVLVFAAYVSCTPFVHLVFYETPCSGTPLSVNSFSNGLTVSSISSNPSASCHAAIRCLGNSPPKQTCTSAHWNSTIGFDGVQVTVTLRGKVQTREFTYGVCYKNEFSDAFGECYFTLTPKVYQAKRFVEMSVEASTLVN